jgi:hypothetical protein
MSKKRNPNPHTLKIYRTEEQSKDEAVAQTFLNPITNAAISIKSHNKKHDEVTVDGLKSELQRQINKVNDGNLQRAEAMLLAQAHTLDSLFTDLLGRSRLNMGEYFHAAEKYMRLALKAQGQCRTTLEALAEIKNPKPYIQNNRAQYQQINNGMPQPHAHDENLKQSNELLEDKSNEEQWLDTRAPETAGGNDKELEALEAKHRAEE